MFCTFIWGLNFLVMCSFWLGEIKSIFREWDEGSERNDKKERNLNNLSLDKFLNVIIDLISLIYKS